MSTTKVAIKQRFSLNPNLLKALLLTEILNAHQENKWKHISGCLNFLGNGQPRFQPRASMWCLSGSHCRAGCTFRMDQLPEPWNCSFSWTARALTQRHSCTSPQPHAQDAGSSSTFAELLQPGEEARGQDGSSPSPEARRCLHLPKATQRARLKAMSQSSRSFQHLTQCSCVKDYKGKWEQNQKMKFKEISGFLGQAAFSCLGVALVPTASQTLAETMHWGRNVHP